jgi:hypothetical protein
MYEHAPIHISARNLIYYTLCVCYQQLESCTHKLKLLYWPFFLFFFMFFSQAERGCGDMNGGEVELLLPVRSFFFFFLRGS